MNWLEEHQTDVDIDQPLRLPKQVCCASEVFHAEIPPASMDGIAPETCCLAKLAREIVMALLAGGAEARVN